MALIDGSGIGAGGDGEDDVGELLVLAVAAVGVHVKVAGDNAFGGGLGGGGGFEQGGQDEDEGLDVFGFGGAGGGSGEFAKFGDAEFVALAGADEEDALGGDSGGREQPDGVGELTGKIAGGDKRRGQGQESWIGGEHLRDGSLVSGIGDESDEQRGCDGGGSGDGKFDLHAHLSGSDFILLNFYRAQPMAIALNL